MKRDTKTDAESSVISSGLKHRANDARAGSSSYSNRRDQSGLNGRYTAMWKENGKNYHIIIFPDASCFLCRQNYPEINYSPNRIPGGGCF